MANKIFSILKVSGNYKTEQTSEGYKGTLDYSLLAKELKFSFYVTAEKGRFGTDSSNFKLIGLTKRKYDDKNIDLLIAFESGAIKDDFYEELINGPLSKPEFFEINYRDQNTGRHTGLKFITDEISLSIYPDKKSFTNTLNTELSEDEVALAKLNAQKQLLIDEMYSKWQPNSLESFKTYKGFEEAYLQDKELLNTIVKIIRQNGDPYGSACQFEAISN